VETHAESPIPGLWPALAALLVAGLGLIIARPKLESPRPTDAPAKRVPHRPGIGPQADGRGMNFSSPDGGMNRLRIRLVNW
jgi:hypothetical protein